MVPNNERGETLMSICAETQGCFGLEPDSGAPNGNYVFARLSQAGYTSASLARADEKDADSITFRYRLEYTDKDQNQIVSKIQPYCLKLSSAVEKCKFKITATAANNAISKEGKRV